MSPSRFDRESRPEPPVTIAGREEVPLDEVPDGALDRLAVERTVGFDCSSGRHVSGVWRGVPVVPLLEHAGLPGGTTHLVVEGADGQAACVPVREAARGLLAFERDGERLGAPRFVAPDVAGPRAVKDVRRIAAVELDPGDSRQAYERFGPGGEADGERRG